MCSGAAVGLRRLHLLAGGLGRDNIWLDEIWRVVVIMGGRSRDQGGGGEKVCAEKRSLALQIWKAGL